MRRARGALVGLAVACTACSSTVTGEASPVGAPLALDTTIDVSVPDDDFTPPSEVLVRSDGSLLLPQVGDSTYLTVVDPQDGTVATRTLEDVERPLAVADHGDRLRVLALQTDPDDASTGLVLLDVDPSSGRTGGEQDVDSDDRLDRGTTLAVPTGDGADFVVLAGTFGDAPHLLLVDAGTGKVTREHEIDLDPGAGNEVDPAGLAVGPEGSVAAVLTVEDDQGRRTVLLRLDAGFAPDGDPVDLAPDAAYAASGDATSPRDLVVAADGTAVVALSLRPSEQSDTGSARVVAVDPAGRVRTIFSQDAETVHDLALAAGGGQVLIGRQPDGEDATMAAVAVVGLASGRTLTDLALCDVGYPQAPTWDDVRGVGYVVGSCDDDGESLWVLR